MSLPKPYYADDSVTLYHGDCYEIAPLIEGVDALITDPPYGMAYNADRSGGTSRGSKLWRDKPTIRGDAAPFDPTPFLAHPLVVLWGANWFSSRLPDNAGWIVWDKTPRGRKEGFIASDCEVAWTNRGNTVAKFSLQWGGEACNGEPRLHPTQKPVALMRWILDKYTKPDDLILDPFMGSGPLARAAKDLGRRYIGIECEEQYIRAAADRCRQEVLL